MGGGAESSFEVIGSEGVKSGEALFQELSEPLKEFFTSFPACKASDKRIRVTEGMVAWKYHMDEVARKSKALNTEQYFRARALAEPILEAQWVLEFLQINEWVKQHNEVHVDICTRYALLEEQRAAEKKQKTKQESEVEFIEDSQMCDRD